MKPFAAQFTWVLISVIEQQALVTVHNTRSDIFMQDPLIIPHVLSNSKAEMSNVHQY